MPLIEWVIDSFFQNEITSYINLPFSFLVLVYFFVLFQFSLFGIYYLSKYSLHKLTVFLSSISSFLSSLSDIFIWNTLTSMSFLCLSTSLSFSTSCLFNLSISLAFMLES